MGARVRTGLLTTADTHASEAIRKPRVRPNSVRKRKSGVAEDDLPTDLRNACGSSCLVRPRWRQRPKQLGGLIVDHAEITVTLDRVVRVDVRRGADRGPFLGGYGRMAPLARPRHRLRHYLRRPGSLMDEFRKTFWRPGFIARLKY